MKSKILFSVAASLLALASCSRTDAPVAEASFNPQVPAPIKVGTTPITFGVEVGGTKSVTETNLATIQGEGFNAFGVVVTNTGASTAFANYIENLSVSLQTGGTYYDAAHVYYYPIEGVMDFYCSNVSKTIAVNNGAATLAYTLDSGRSYDLVAATAYGVAASGNAVPLSFAHILAQVQMKAACSDPMVVCKVTSITASAPAGGTYSFVRGNSASDSWGSYGDAASYALFTNASGSVIATTGSDQWTNLGETAVMMPTSTTFTVAWQCSIGAQVVATYSRNVTIDLDKGKLNNVKLTLPNNSAQAIQFTVTVQEWGSVDKEATLES